MNIKITPSEFRKWKGDTIAAFAFSDGGKPSILGLGSTAGALAALASADGFSARERETHIVRPADRMPAERILLIGLGKRDEFSFETLRRAASAVLRLAERLKQTTIAVRAPQVRRNNAAEIQALAEG